MLLCSRYAPPWVALALTVSSFLAAQSPVHSALMLERFGKPYVMVTVNGKGPYRFIIDTGTGADAFVSPELADELHLPADGEALLSDPGKQSPQRVPIVLLQSLELAGVEFPLVRAVRHTITGEAGSCSGLLGFTLFKDHLLTLDFPGRAVTLTQGSLTPDGERTVLPFRISEGVPIATLRLGGRPVEAQFDSGGGGLTLPEHMATYLKWEIPPVAFAIGSTLTTKFSIKAAKLAFDVKVGKFTFHHPVVEIHPAFPMVNFGSPPMQSFAITFDQKSLLLRLLADQNVLYLKAPPAPTRLKNLPDPEPPPRGLLPLG